MAAPGLRLPVLLFDGDCGFCRQAVEKWSRVTAGRVEYRPYQEALSEFPEIPAEKCEQSVVYVDRDGTAFFGAEAVFSAWATNPEEKIWLWAYRRVPGFRTLAEAWYRRVSKHRPFFSGLTRLFSGKTPPGSHAGEYELTRRLFLSALGFVYLCAFVSLAVQIRGLVGENGILPAGEFFQMVAERFGSDAYRLAPSLFWISTRDSVLVISCWVGAALAVALIAGYGSIVALPAAWLLYLSLFYAGQVFLGYQWDLLLLETGFLAIFLAPPGLRPRSFRGSRPSPLVICLFRWLLFRLMLGSALVKYLSGDPSWRDLTALTFHYETQPLPTWIAYYLHQLPVWFQRLSAAFMFFIEGVVPFFIFSPRRLRTVAAWLLIALQVLIFLSGNYGFFNLLTIALCLLLFDDQSWPLAWQRRFYGNSGTPPQAGRRGWPRWVLYPVATVLLFLSVPAFLDRHGSERNPGWVGQFSAWVSPFRLIGSYGLFAVMTKSRPEITVEGSRDGINWLPYVFADKPGPLARRPGFIAPHQPRLDWQMWFAALAPFSTQYWFQSFLFSLLNGSPEVLKLLKANPFPGEAPKWVRATLSDYEFTSLPEKKKSGEWWRRSFDRPYSPILEKAQPQVP